MITLAKYPSKLFLTLSLGVFSLQAHITQGLPTQLHKEMQPPSDISYEFEKETAVENNDDALVLDIPTAINMAFQANRNLANAIDGITKSQLNLNLVESNFRLSVTPSLDLGYIGGGEAGVGSTIGGSLELCKKFSYGTRLSIRPYATRDAKHYHTGVKAKIVQPLLKGFGQTYTLSPVYSAKFSNRTAIRGAYASCVEMITRLIQSLYAVVRIEALLKLDVEALTRLKHFYSAIKVKERIGMADSLDVYRTETEIKHAEDVIESSKEILQDARDRVREILALPLEKNIFINISTDYSPLDPDMQQAIDAALSNRIEIDQATDRWEESKRLSRLAKVNTLPDLDLVLDFSNIGYDEVFTNSFTSERDSRWGVGFMTSTDWNRYAQEAAYQQSLLSVLGSERNFQQSQDNVILDVKRAIRSLRRTSQKIELQLKQIHSSEGGLRLAKLKFDRGLANNFDVIQAEKTLRNALTSHLNAIIEHKIGEYRFIAAMGLLVDKPKI